MWPLYKCVNCGMPSKTPFCVHCGGMVECRFFKKGCSKCGHLVETKFCPKCGGRTAEISVVEKPKPYSIRPLAIIDWESYCGVCNFKPPEPEKAFKDYCTECGSRKWKKIKRGGFVCQSCKDYSKERYRYCGRCGGKITEFLLQQ